MPRPSKTQREILENVARGMTLSLVHGLRLTDKSHFILSGTGMAQRPNRRSVQCLIDGGWLKMHPAGWGARHNKITLTKKGRDEIQQPPS